MTVLTSQNAFSRLLSQLTGANEFVLSFAGNKRVNSAERRDLTAEYKPLLARNGLMLGKNAGAF